MFDLLIFCTTLLMTLIVGYYFYQSRKPAATTIPSLKPSDSKLGNISEIKLLGGIHSFLTDLHNKLGPIAGFWFGEDFVVSLASPELFKEELKIFDRPPILFNCLEPLLGSSSIQFANGEDGKQRRKCYDRYFNHLACKSYTDQFLQIGENLSEIWAHFPSNEHIPLHQQMMTLALKSILSSAFGFAISEENDIQFHSLYEFVWSQLSSKMIGNKLIIDNAQDKLTAEKIEEMHLIIRNIIEARKKLEVPEEQTFLDFLLSEDVDEERCLHDCVTYIVGGFHTTGNLLTWIIYYLALHEEIQEKVYQEISAIFGKSAITEEKLCDLIYTRQVIDETIRCSVLAPYAARYRDYDAKIGGHIIPKGTPVIHALGVVLTDQNIWASPSEFKPNRFDRGAFKQQSPLSFKPFGFAGQRICPGQKFAYCEATTYLSILLKRFKISLVEKQTVTPVRGLVSRPKDEIFIQIAERNELI